MEDLPIFCETKGCFEKAIKKYKNINFCNKCYCEYKALVKNETC